MAFNKLLETCERKRIAVLFTYAPEFKRSLIRFQKNPELIFGYYDSVSVAKRIPFLRNDMLPLNDSGKYFANAGHLNRAGAVVYSRIFAQQLADLGYHR